MNYKVTLKSPWIIAPLCLLVGGFIGYKLNTEANHVLDSIQSLRQPTSKFKWIARLLAIDYTDPKDFKEYGPLQGKINSEINQEKVAGNIDDEGIYFRDLTTGHWVGVNENNHFFPASLLKVPVMFSYFKQAQSDPGVLKQILIWDGKNDLNQSETFRSPNEIKPNQAYTVDDLIRY